MDLKFYEKLNTYRTDSKSFSCMANRVRINALIAEHYERMGDEYEDVIVSRGKTSVSMKYLMYRRASRLLRCGRFVDTLRFNEIGIHEVKAVKLCCDKFCGNCQKQLANARERKYTPLLNELAKHFDLYHISFTVPNMSGMFLPKAVEDILKAYSKLHKFLSGRKKIRGLAFDSIGYMGSIRSLEITHNEDKQNYHPHLHCIFVFRKGLNLDEPKVFTNDFSFSNGRKVRQFSAFEVFIQRLWKVCYDGERVTKAAIEASGGYSCIVNRAEGNYHQIFKYAVKGLLDEKKAEIRKSKGKINRNLTYEEVHDMYFALEGRRVMQGYGCFYGLKFDESVLTDPNGTEAEIREIIHELQKLDTGEFVSEKLASVIENIVKKNEIYFSKDSVKKNLDCLQSDD